MDILLAIDWRVSPEIVSIGGFKLVWYGLLFASSFIVGQYLMTHIFQKEGKYAADVDTLTMYMVLGTVLGARLGHCLFYQPDYYLANPIEILMVWHGGLASHGAFFGIVAGIFLYMRGHQDQPFLWIADRIVIIVALAGCFIRFGNLMNSEIVGKPTDLPWAFVFHVSTSLTEAERLIPRHPSQLYESITCLILLVILFMMWKAKKSQMPMGRLFGIFLIYVFTLRFFYEFLKENQVPFEDSLPLNMGQFLSIPLVIIGLWALWKSYADPKLPPHAQKSA